ncbi:MAG: lysine--tRNA ligase [Candidatus Ancillula sp.]|jgi:lysyl-tRNA synthetase class 2|nr:lysine--tRNA ligase [Candidatus Ancillula sp.]
MADEELQNDESQDFEQMLIRKKKRSSLIATDFSGGDFSGGAYPVSIPISHSIAQVRASYANLNAGDETQDVVSVAGRVVFMRDAGKLMFVVLQSGEGERLQIMFNARELETHRGVTLEDEVNGAGVPLDAGGASLKNLKRTVDLGDHLFASGRVISSKTGELSVMASRWQLASKALRPLPVLHKDLSDESRIRRRYVDLISRQEARDMVRTRAAVVKSLRRNFDERGFLELETPMLQTVHGGAAARPFETHINAFDMDLYLRIAPELYLKRAVVGGVEKVFEINRNFRNEGVDSSHSPEFSMLEAYEAYGDYNSMADLTQNLVERAAEDALGTLKLSLPAQAHPDVVSGKVSVQDAEDFTYSFEPSAWSRITMYGSLSDASGVKVTPQTTLDDLMKLAEKVGLAKEILADKTKLKYLTHGKMVELLWEHFVGDSLWEPTFVFDFPLDTSPLTRNHRSIEGVVEKWDLYVRGFELATAYSELVDPVVQRERLDAQASLAAKGDDEAMPQDEDFIEALEYGMPPTGGMGMGIDRLLMALTGKGIRETIPFPLVKPSAKP